jgi:hypothetical protein
MRHLIILRIGYWALVFALTAIAALVARQHGGPTAAWLTIGAGLLVGYVVYTQGGRRTPPWRLAASQRPTGQIDMVLSRRIGAKCLEPTPVFVGGGLLLQPLNEYVGISGVVGRTPHLLQLLFHPAETAARHPLFVKPQRRRSPTRPDAQVMHIFDVVIGVPGCKRQIVQNLCHPVLQRESGHFVCWLVGADPLDPFFA